MTRQVFANVPKADPELAVALEKSKQRPAGSGKFVQSEKGAIEQQGQANSAPRRPEAGPDNEVWVRDRVMTAIRMALMLNSSIEVGADRPAYERGVRGVATGTAIEILSTLGFDTTNLINLR